MSDQSDKQNLNNSSEVESEQKQSDSAKRDKRRKLLVGGGVIGASQAVPSNWGKAVVNSVILPGHAQTSDDPDGGGDGAAPSPAPATPAPATPAPATPAPATPAPATPAPTTTAPTATPIRCCEYVHWYWNGSCRRD